MVYDYDKKQYDEESIVDQENISIKVLKYLKVSLASIFSEFECLHPPSTGWSQWFTFSPRNFANRDLGTSVLMCMLKPETSCFRTVMDRALCP